uniref:Uncharacterized protein n=1 Tax=Tetranychus urticae TaxID=32264 RepID=T1K7M7_TETUR
MYLLDNKASTRHGIRLTDNLKQCGPIVCTFWSGHHITTGTIVKVKLET